MMNPEQRKRFLILHNDWGVVLALPILFMFITGTFAFIKSESLSWSRPQYVTESRIDLDRIFNKIQSKGEPLKSINISLPTSEHPHITILTRGEEEDDRSSFAVDPSDYSFHKDAVIWYNYITTLHYFRFLPDQSARWVAGFVSLGFFILMIAGFIYVLKTFLKEFRLPKQKIGTQIFWEKWHRFTSVLSLPIQLIYSFTGTLWFLGFMIVPPMAAFMFFSGDTSAMMKLFRPFQGITVSERVEPAGLNSIYKVAEKDFTDAMHITGISVESKEGIWEKVTFRAETRSGGLIQNGQRVYDMSGNLLGKQDPGENVASSSLEVTFRLHFGNIFGYGFKYFMTLLGCLGCYSIACGMNIWLGKPGTVKKKFLHPFTKITTITLTAGSMVGMAAAFHATLTFPQYAIEAFWYGMLFSLLLSIPFSAGKNYRIQFVLNALLWLSLPVHHYIYLHGIPYGELGRSFVLRMNLFMIILGLVSIACAVNPRLICWFERESLSKE